MTVEYKLQNVLLEDTQRTHDYPEMYVRTYAPLLFDEDGKTLTMPEASQYRFDTYFGGLSTKKWNRYTDAHDFALHIKANGAFEIRMTYFINDMEYNIASRNTAYSKRYDTQGKTEEIICEYPDDIALNADMVAFEIITSQKTTFYGAWYTAQVAENAIREIDLNIISPTFKKEDYVRKNVKLFEQLLESDEPIADHLTVTIVDNGQTLGDEPLSTNSAIKKFNNRNYGGAGGFSRGMLEALHADKKPTHLLVMDDDVSVSPESFVRTFNLLRVLNDEYKDAFISGAMISMQLQDRQYEDVGNIFSNGMFGPAKWERNLSDINHVVSNETVRYNHYRQYCAFWYCCFPITAVEETGFCMPFFVRCDDAEFNLRVPGRKYITMNGICVWHLTFGKSKFNMFNECYLSIRNTLIVQAICEDCEELDMYGFFRHEIETLLRKYDYAYAELECDAVEDYLKGPTWLASTDPEMLLKEKNQKKPKTVEFELLSPDASRLWEQVPLTLQQRVKMKFTHNGHTHCKDSDMSDVPAVVPNDFRSYLPSRIYMRKELWMLNDDLSTGYKTHIDRERYKKIMDRVTKLDKRMKEEGERVAAEWRAARPYLTSEEFWIGFLGLNPDDYRDNPTNIDTADKDADETVAA